jgi:hypothetical protein
MAACKGDVLVPRTLKVSKIFSTCSQVLTFTVYITCFFIFMFSTLIVPYLFQVRVKLFC